MTQLWSILVVDDSQEICDLVKAALEEELYEVACALTGSQARTILAREAIDLIILDYFLPGETGRHIAELAGDLDIAVIIMTASPESIEDVGLLAAATIQKPFSLSELVSVMQGVLLESWQKQRS